MAEPRTAVPIPAGPLPISRDLRAKLDAWSSAYDETFRSSDRGSDGFETINDAERFVEHGRRLAADLQDDLGEGYHIEYYPEPSRPPGVRLR